MDQMLPSPGFSIPSIGTPLHQPEEDQQILPHAQQQQQMPMLATPQKTMPHYAPGFTTPQSLMQPQTPAKFLDFKIQNMVGSCDVKFPIRLEGLVLTHGQFSSYEPELFPGLIYRMVKPRIVLLIFVSGKVVLTGAKVRQEIYEAFDNIYPILKSFKKQ